MAITIEDVKRVILGTMEDTDRADRILAALRQHDGKLLTERVMDKVREATGETRAYIRRQYGMCAIEFGGYSIQQDPDPGLCLYVAHRETNVRINADDIKSRNPSYFDAAKRRNEDRRKALTNEDGLWKMACAIECMNVGAKAFEALTEYGEAFSEVRFAIERELISEDLPKIDRK